MGTRADLWIGRGENAEWLGSIGWDGYPSGIDKKIFKKKTEKTYRNAVLKFLAEREDATLPADGWPWPWEDSHLTDYSYSFYEGKVYMSGFGRAWVDISSGEETETFDNEEEFIEHCKNEELKEEEIADLRTKAIIFTERQADCPVCTHKYDPSVIYPDMKKVQNISMGKGSGLMFITLGPSNSE